MLGSTLLLPRIAAVPGGGELEAELDRREASGFVDDARARTRLPGEWPGDTRGQRWLLTTGLCKEAPCYRVSQLSLAPPF